MKTGISTFEIIKEKFRVKTDFVSKYIIHSTYLYFLGSKLKDCKQKEIFF